MRARCAPSIAPPAVSILLGWLLVTAVSAAPRPPAPRLLPAETLVYVRVADVPEMLEQFRQTMLGRISQDEQVRPLLYHIWGSLLDSAQMVEDQLGVPLEDLLAVPQGETCVALVAPPEGRLALVLLMEVGDRLPVVEKVLERMETALAEQGARRSTQRIGDSELVVHELTRGPQREFVHLQRDGTLIFSTNAQVARGLVEAWDGRPASTLAENPAFAAIMKRCAGEQGETPQGTFFVDALELARRVARGNVAGQVFLALLNPLGLDGIRGVGGSLTLVTEHYDSLLHVHLLLDRPRRGVLEVLALSGGSLTPESWAPADAVSYTSLQWDVPTSYNALRDLYDAIRGEGALAGEVNRRLSSPLGIDFEKEFLDALQGRVTHVSWMVRPARLNSRANLVGLQLKQPAAFRRTWLQVTEQLQNQLERKAMGTTEYWQLNVPPPPAASGEALMRQPDPAFALVGDYLLISDSSELMRHAILTYADASASLANELDFKLIASRIRRQNGGENPGLLSFSRPEEAMRLLYELAASETTRDRLAAQGGANPFLGALDGALRDHPLPPFSVIAQYLAPGGSLLTNDETGFHYTRFTLRRK